MSPTLALADAECMDLSDIVDTERYPLQAPDSPKIAIWSAPAERNCMPRAAMC